MRSRIRLASFRPWRVIRESPIGFIRAISPRLSGLAIALTMVLSMAFSPEGLRARAESPAAVADREVDVQLRGSLRQEPLDKVRILVTEGYGSQQRKFGPFSTNDRGIARLRLPVGFFELHLDADRDWPYLRAERYSQEEPIQVARRLCLRVTSDAVEKWLEGKPRDPGADEKRLAGEPPLLVYRLFPACELVLKAIDIDTGRGLAGVTFDEENDLAEDWAHPIVPDHLRMVTRRADAVPSDTRQATDDRGEVRFWVGEKAGYKLSIAQSPPNYEAVEPRREVEFNTNYGRNRVEIVFKFRRKT